MAGIAEDVGAKFLGTVDRIGQFFHIFDLSFFVSGTVTVAAFTYYYLGSGISGQFPFPAWAGVISLLIACYVGGLLSFSIGRACNFFRRAKIEKILGPLVDELSAEEKQKFGAAHNKKVHLHRLYALLWQELVFVHAESVSFSHLNRYWVMAATYDGLAAALVFWVVALLLPAEGRFIAHLSYWFSAPRLVAAIAALALAFMALRTGAQYLEYQIYDLVAACIVGRKLKRIG